jgi:hypothetical protein
MVGEAFCTTGRDPTDYGEWTRYLVVRPLVVAGPAGAACLVFLIVALVLGAPDEFAYLLAVIGLAAGLMIGVWLWSRSEADRRSSAKREHEAAV